MVIGLLFSPIALLLCGPSGGLTISHSSTNRAHPFATSVQLSHSSKFHHLHNIIHRIHRQTHIVVSSLSFFFLHHIRSVPVSRFHGCCCVSLPFNVSSIHSNYMDIGNTLVSQVFCRFVGLFLSVCRCYCWRHEKEVKKSKVKK